jgi:hypothetical protein
MPNRWCSTEALDKRGRLTEDEFFSALSLVFGPGVAIPFGSPFWLDVDPPTWAWPVKGCVARA